MKALVRLSPAALQRFMQRDCDSTLISAALLQQLQQRHGPLTQSLTGVEHRDDGAAPSERAVPILQLTGSVPTAWAKSAEQEPEVGSDLLTEVYEQGCKAEAYENGRNGIAGRDSDEGLLAIGAQEVTGILAARRRRELVDRAFNVWQARKAKQRRETVLEHRITQRQSVERLRRGTNAFGAWSDLVAKTQEVRGLLVIGEQMEGSRQLSREASLEDMVREVQQKLDRLSAVEFELALTRECSASLHDELKATVAKLERTEVALKERSLESVANVGEEMLQAQQRWTEREEEKEAKIVELMQDLRSYGVLEDEVQDLAVTVRDINDSVKSHLSSASSRALKTKLEAFAENLLTQRQSAPQPTSAPPAAPARTVEGEQEEDGHTVARRSLLLGREIGQPGMDENACHGRGGKGKEDDVGGVQCSSTDGQWGLRALEEAKGAEAAAVARLEQSKLEYRSLAQRLAESESKAHTLTENVGSYDLEVMPLSLSSAFCNLT